MAPRKMKLTQELVDSWLELAWRDGFKKGRVASQARDISGEGTEGGEGGEGGEGAEGGDISMPNFKEFIPQDTSSSFEDQSKLPFNPSKCEARILKDGYGIQCSRSRFSGGCLCKTHQDKFDSLSPGLDIPFGRYNKDRPTHSLDLPNGGNKIAWYDTKKTRAPRQPGKCQTPNIKIGELRDYLSTRIPNENFKGMKKAELRDLYDKEKAKEKQSCDDQEDSSKPVDSEEVVDSSKPVDSEEVVDSSKPVDSEEAVDSSENLANDAPTEPAPVENCESALEQSQSNCDQRLDKLGAKELLDVSEEKVNSGVGTLVESVPRTKKEYSAVFEKLGIDAGGLSGVRSYKQRYAEYLEEKSEETEDMSDVDPDDLQEDESSFQKIDFEGVEYLEDEDTAELYNTSYKKVGKWNEDSDNIIWVSKEYEEEHEQKSC